MFKKYLQLQTWLVHSLLRIHSLELFLGILVSVLSDLHWLPVRHRISFKLVSLSMCYSFCFLLDGFVSIWVDCSQLVSLVSHANGVNESVGYIVLFAVGWFQSPVGNADWMVLYCS